MLPVIHDVTYAYEKEAQMNPYEKRLLSAALQAETEARRDAMRKQEQAFGAVVCVVCIVIIGCVAIGAGYRAVRNMIEAAQVQEVGK